MKQKNLAISLGAILFSTIILFFSCKKINEATQLGGDLIPEVDNIHTFDTSLEVQAFNDSFTFASDTVLAVGYSGTSVSASEYFIGKTNDPFFGGTDARVYLQLKPISFGTLPFGATPDKLHIDSVVLVLNYVDTYGDSTVPQTVNVFEVAQNQSFQDSSYNIRRNPFLVSTQLGTANFLPSTLDDSVKVYRDTSANQLRIRLDNSFGQRLLDYDTVASGGRLPAYKSDSAFSTYFKGFALEPVSGNSLVGVAMSGANTKLAIYYKRDNATAGQDTVVTNFIFTTSSASANLVRRDYTGTAFASSVNGITLPADDFVYIQSAPGSYARLKIPALPSLSNRIVHRAELIMEQVYEASDLLFPPPRYLYLDAYNPEFTLNSTIPYDVLYDGSSSFNLGAFGIIPDNALDASNNLIKVWHFNLSRYVQNVVNKVQAPYDLRIHTPFYVQNEYKPTAASAASVLLVKPPTISNYGRGRVRLGGGNHPNQKMRLRIVYSKI